MCFQTGDSEDHRRTKRSYDPRPAVDPYFDGRSVTDLRPSGIEIASRGSIKSTRKDSPVQM